MQHRTENVENKHSHYQSQVCSNWEMRETLIYLTRIDDVYFCPARKYSTNIVNTTVVLLKVVYIGTFTPRIDSMDTNFKTWNELYTATITSKSNGPVTDQNNFYLPCKVNRKEQEVGCESTSLQVPI